jgi:4-amino-4-deoxy-L-arabinose transferase-like glycosyltransferase
MGAVVGLGLATAFSRVPFRSRYLFSWDSANFALALDAYNVGFHQPHPPGYPLYVASAWVARLVLRDANTSLVALSIVASGLAVVFLAMAAAHLYGRTVAALAAVLLATSSLLWSQSEVAYPYAFLALFTSLVGWLSVLIQRGGRLAGLLTVLAGLAIGIGAGFRTELLAFLGPLWLYAALRRPARWPDRLSATLAGAAALTAAVVAWYVPMVQRSGGWAAYQSATQAYYAYFIETTSGARRLLLGVLENGRALIGFVYNGIGLALLPAIYFLGRFFAPPLIVADRRVRFLLLWMTPPVAFYLTVHIGNPGYVLSLLPPLCIFVALAVRGFVEDCVAAAAAMGWRGAAAGAARRVTLAATAIVAVIGLSNTLLFLAADGEGRLREIRQIDRTFARQLAVIRGRYPPDRSVLFAYDRSRQYRYYLPAYRIELLFDVAVAGAVTDTSRYWERRRTFVVPAGLDAVLFPDLGRNTSDQPGLVERVDLGEGVELYLARVRPGDEVRYGYQYASVVRVQAAGGPG